MDLNLDIVRYQWPGCSIWSCLSLPVAWTVQLVCTICANYMHHFTHTEQARDQFEVSIEGDATPNEGRTLSKSKPSQLGVTRNIVPFGPCSERNFKRTSTWFLPTYDRLCFRADPALPSCLFL